MEFSSMQKDLVLIYPEEQGIIQKTVATLSTQKEAERLARSLNSVLETMNKKDASYCRGYREGHIEGYGEGHLEGHREGFEQGYNEGLQEGHEQGHEKGTQEVKDLLYESWKTISNF